MRRIHAVALGLVLLVPARSVAAQSLLSAPLRIPNGPVLCRQVPGTALVPYAFQFMESDSTARRTMIVTYDSIGRSLVLVSAVGASEDGVGSQTLIQFGAFNRGAITQLSRDQVDTMPAPRSGPDSLPKGVTPASDEQVKAGASLAAYLWDHRCDPSIPRPPHDGPVDYEPHRSPEVGRRE